MPAMLSVLGVETTEADTVSATLLPRHNRKVNMADQYCLPGRLVRLVPLTMLKILVSVFE